MLVGSSIFPLMYFTDNWSWLLPGILCYFFFGSVGMAAGLHRYWGHGAFKMSKPMEYIVTTLGAFNGYGSIFPWVLIHTENHHKNSDTEKDPHTPMKGFWYSFLTWHRDENLFAVPRKTLAKYIKRGFLNNRYYKFLNDYHIAIHYSMFSLIWLLFGWEPALFVFWFGVWATVMNTALVTSLGHYKWMGYQNFNTNDNSINNRLGGLLTWGEMLHNNHHGRWTASTNSTKPSEIDVTGWAIEVLRRC